jgi:hypothetical protein
VFADAEQEQPQRLVAGGEEELEKELVDMEAQLELTVGQNPDILNQYEDRKRAVRIPAVTFSCRLSLTLTCRLQTWR